MEHATQHNNNNSVKTAIQVLHYCIGTSLVCITSSIKKLSNQKHPKHKKEWPRAKTGLAEKDVKSNRQPRPPSFDKFESFDHYDFTAKYCYFRCSRSDVDVINFLKDDQAAKEKEKCFAAWSSLSILSTIGGLEHLK